jgi:tellurite resistance protein
MSVEIGRNTVLALCAIAWADGKIDPEEAVGIRDAAKQLGLSSDDLTAVDAALAQAFDLSQVETVRMNRLTRLFTYACGVWIAGLDGSIGAEEQKALQTLGDRVGLSDVARTRAQTVVTGALSGGDVSKSKIDLQKLRSRLSAGLSQIGND